MLTPESINLIFPIIAAICGAMLWLGYFKRIDLLEHERITDIIIAFVIGFLTPTLSLWIYFGMEVLGFNFNGKIINDFIYSILGVGLTEELSKLLGVLIALKIINKRVNEPIDYLVFAGIVALGFSVRENFIFYTNYGAHIASGRTFITSLVHIINTSICIYGIYRFRIFNKGNTYINAFLGISLAVVSHGLFDFFLVQPFWGEFTSLLATTVYLIGVNFWIQMINNTINFSPFFNYQKIASTTKLYYSIFIWYIIILGLEYVYGIIYFDEATAFKQVFESVVREGLVLIIVALRASRLDINKGKYFPIKIQSPIYFTTNDNADFSIFGLNFKIRGENQKEMQFLNYVDRDILLCSITPETSVLKGDRKATIIKKYSLKNDVITYLVKIVEDDETDSFYLLKPKTLSDTLYQNKYPIARLMLYNNDDIETYKQTNTDYHQLAFLEEVYLKELI